MNCDCVYCKNNNKFEMPKDIIDNLKTGNLVLFCGGGISTESKNVLPDSFYATVCDEINCDMNLSFSEAMSKYCKQPNGRKKLVKKVLNRFNYISSFPELYRSATRFHRELSSLYMIDTIVTTNWDDYFEKECKAIPILLEQDLALWDSSYRKVLKIHGSINNIGTVVATKEDYEKCYNELTTSLIGGKLKSLLAIKTVVFIGYSFGDEDLNQILQFIEQQMKEFMPHIYIVTIDSTLKSKITYPNITVIVTDGAFFLHSVKKELVDADLVKNLCNESDIYSKYAELRQIHEIISEVDSKKFPINLYSLLYQDGMLHAFERYLAMKDTGDYNKPFYIQNAIESYELKVEYHKTKRDYFEEAYFAGYRDGLIGLLMEKEELRSLPCCVSYPDQYYADFEKYLEMLVEDHNKEYEEVAKAKTEKLAGAILHHPPIG